MTSKHYHSSIGEKRPLPARELRLPPSTYSTPRRIPSSSDPLSNNLFNLLRGDDASPATLTPHRSPLRFPSAFRDYHPTSTRQTTRRTPSSARSNWRATYPPARSPRRRTQLPPRSNPFSNASRRATPKKSPPRPAIETVCVSRSIQEVRSTVPVETRYEGPLRGVYDEKNKMHTQFRWTGQLTDLRDADIPYEIVRGQVIPYYESDQGERFYFAGIDRASNEVGGFGGTIEGRQNAKRAREDLVEGAFREFAEESMCVFFRYYNRSGIRDSHGFVVGNTLVILLRVYVEPDVLLGDFERLVSQSKNYSAKKFRENSGIAVASDKEMRAIAQGKKAQIDGLDLWSKYADIVRFLFEKYAYLF